MKNVSWTEEQIEEALQTLREQGLFAKVLSTGDCIEGGIESGDLIAGMRLLHRPFRIVVGEDGGADLRAESQSVWSTPFDSLADAVQYVIDTRKERL